MSDKPKKPSDRRPDDKPYFIDNDCPQCGTELVLNEKYQKGDDFDPEEAWHDEFICPECEDGLYLDAPKEFEERLVALRNSTTDGSQDVLEL